MISYEEILQFVKNAGSNCVQVFGGDFDGGYELQQSPPEIAQLLFDYKDVHINNFLEIGTASAGNTRIICDFLDVENIYTIDLNIHDSIPRARDNNFAALKFTGKMYNFWGDSHSAEAKAWLGSFDVKYDFAFIDGDHSEEGVHQDTEMVLPFLEKGALVIFHDIIVSGVGCSDFDKKLKKGIIPSLKHVKDYIGGSKPKGIGVYRFET